MLEQEAVEELETCEGRWTSSWRSFHQRGGPHVQTAPKMGDSPAEVRISEAAFFAESTPPSTQIPTCAADIALESFAPSPVIPTTKP